MRTLWAKGEGVAPYPLATLKKIEAGHYVLTPYTEGDKGTRLELSQARCSSD